MSPCQAQGGVHVHVKRGRKKCEKLRDWHQLRPAEDGFDCAYAWQIWCADPGLIRSLVHPSAVKQRVGQHGSAGAKPRFFRPCMRTYRMPHHKTVEEDRHRRKHPLDVLYAATGAHQKRKPMVLPIINEHAVLGDQGALHPSAYSGGFTRAFVIRSPCTCPYSIVPA